jgi:hypothetical protein
MKIQDILFFVVFIPLLLKKHPGITAGVGIFCLFLAIPLYAKWVFFTAERLVWYGVSLLTLSIFQAEFFQNKHTHI